MSKAYRRGPEIVHAVQDVSLIVSSSELLGLIGRSSGSGKTLYERGLGLGAP